MRTSSQVVDVLGEWRNRLGGRAGDLAAVAVFALLLGLPKVTSDPYVFRVLILACIFAVLALGYNVVLGITGLLAFSQATFWAIGAYTAAIANTRFSWGIWQTLPVAAGVTTVVGIVYGLVMLRFRSHYLAMATLGISVIFADVLRNVGSITGGSNGIVLVEPAATRVGPVTLPSLSLTGFYAVSLAVLAVTSYLLARLRRSDVGTTLVTIRENPLAAQASGVPIHRYKVLAFTVSALCGGVAGAVYAHYITVITPEVSGLNHVVTLLLILVIGGLGGHYGIIVSSVVVVALPEYLRFLDDSRMIVYGVAVVVILLVRRHKSLLRGLIRPRSAASASTTVSPSATTSPSADPEAQGDDRELERDVTPTPGSGGGLAEGGRR